jgi:glycosyltransferase involved in cell wall biosynthesis
VADAGVSVVIPCYNAAETLDRQLAALAGQQWQGDWEVIVADNGSTDETAASAEKWADRLPALVVVSADRCQGASAARNDGARSARYDLIAFVDADDEVMPGWLAAIAERGRTAPFFAATQRPVVLDEHAWAARPTSDPKPIFADEGFLDAEGAGLLVCRREVFDAVGGFDEQMVAAEDTAFCFSAQLCGYTLGRAPEAVIKVYPRENLRRAARQQFVWGYGAAQLYRRFASQGMPRSPIWRVLLGWAAVAGMAPAALVNAKVRSWWIGAASRRAGRLVGSVRERVFYL